MEGTSPYQSLAAEQLKPQSYKDDLESLCFLLWDLFHGPLHWVGKVADAKTQAKPPGQLALVLKYARSLKFDDLPDLDYLLSLLPDSCDRDPESAAPEAEQSWSLEEEFEILPLSKERPIEAVPGLTKGDVTKLRDAGFRNALHLASTVFFDNGGKRDKMVRALAELGLSHPEETAMWLSLVNDF